MASDEIPGEVRRFILAVIPSVPHLEALLLLHGRQDGWTSAELARRLYLDEAAAAALLADLAAAALVSGAGGAYRFAPADAQMAATVDALAALYARQVVPIAGLIHSSSDRKAQRFADAFRLRKEP